MVISVKHNFLSGKADSADPSVIKPSNWNAEHTMTMAANRLLGHGSTAGITVNEISLSADLSFNGSELQLSDTFRTDMDKKANKATLVSEQPHLDPATDFNNPTTFIPISNSGSGKNGKITANEFKSLMGLVPSTITIMGGKGMNGGGDLTANRTIGMLTPGDLSGTTDSIFADVAGQAIGQHFHKINSISVASIGMGTMAHNAAGSTIFAKVDSATVLHNADEVAGSKLTFCSVDNANTNVGVGTWSLHGFVDGDQSNGNRSCWTRKYIPTMALDLVEYQNPTYNGDGTIDVEIDVDGNWTPTTLNLNDIEPWYVDLFHHIVAAGGIGVFIPPSANQLRERVEQVTQRQLRIALLAEGKNTSAIMAAIDGIADANERELANIEFIYADRFRRLNPSVVLVLSILGFTPGSMDSLWNAALAVTS